MGTRFIGDLTPTSEEYEDSVGGPCSVVCTGGTMGGFFFVAAGITLAFLLMRNFGPTADATPAQLLTRMVTPDDDDREWDDIVSESAISIDRPASTEPQSAAATHARSGDIAVTPARAGCRSAEPPRDADTEPAAAVSATAGCRSAEPTHSQAPPSYPSGDLPRHQQNTTQIVEVMFVEPEHESERCSVHAVNVKEPTLGTVPDQFSLPDSPHFVFKLIQRKLMP
ncbi:hypothetical protein MTO96_029053 [Rhipicephalus appendiculatus]